MTEFRDREFRDTMGQFCTGVVIVAGSSDGNLVGFAAQSFVSLSLTPPLVAVCPGKTSSSWPRIRDTGHFCINVLGKDQQNISDAFAQTGKVADMIWRTGDTGAPILDGVIAYVDCSLESEHDGGDHTIAVGRVIDLGVVDPDAGPLLFFRGGYGRFES